MSRKPYIRPLAKSTWWLSQGLYTSYMVREVTCIFIGIYSTILIWGLMRLSEGKDAWMGFVQALGGELSIAFHAIALFFVLWHTFSWFNVTPRAMRIQTGDHFLPGPVIVGAHYGGWVVVSIVFLWVAGA